MNEEKVKELIRIYCEANNININHIPDDHKRRLFSFLADKKKNDDKQELKQKQIEETKIENIIQTVMSRI